MTAIVTTNVTTMAVGGAITFAVALALLGVGALLSRRGRERVTVIEARSEVPKEQWTMPPAALLSRPTWSRARKLAISALGSYMVVATALLIVKSIQLAGV